MAREAIPAADKRANVIELPPPHRDRRGRPGHVPPVEPVAVLTVVAVLQAALFGASFLFSGYYAFTQWGLLALVSSTVLVAALLVRPPRLTRAGALMLGGLVAFAAWAAVSVTWAESAENAWREVARFGLYAVTVALALTVVRSATSARRVLDVLTIAMAGLVVYVLGRMVVGGAGTMFVDHRLHEPLGYINGQAGLLLMAFWLLFAAGERASRPVPAGALLTLAVGAAQLLVLTQSRAVLPALALSLLLVLALADGRLRRASALLLTFVAVGAAMPALLDVLDQDAAVPGSRPTDAVLRSAGLLAILTACAAGAVWAAARGLARRVGVGAGARRTLGLALVAIFLAAAGFGVASVHDPVARAQSEIDAFKNLEIAPVGSGRFVSGGGFRYDLWRVALEEFSRDPLRGTGAGNYPTAFALHRRSPQFVRQPHSLELQALGELGAPGALFLLVFIAGAAAAAWSARRAVDRRLAVAGIGAGSAWMVHTSVDWLHNLPGVTGIALLCLALLAVAGRDVADEDQPPTADTRPFGRAALIVGLCALALLAATVGRLYAADAYRRDATDAIPRDPRQAVRIADRALSIDGDLLDAYYAKAAALARLGEYAGARDALLAAAGREPRNHVPQVLLGDLATRRGDTVTARRHYQQADRLNPYDARLQPLAPPTETP